MKNEQELSYDIRMGNHCKSLTVRSPTSYVHHSWILQSAGEPQENIDCNSHQWQITSLLSFEPQIQGIGSPVVTFEITPEAGRSLRLVRELGDDAGFSGGSAAGPEATSEVCDP